MLISFKFLGTEFIPTLDEGNIYLRITFPYSIALSTSHKYANEVRQYMMTFPEVISQIVEPEGLKMVPMTLVLMIQSILSSFYHIPNGPLE